MAPRQLSSEIAGWLLFWCLLWLCFALAAPVIAEAKREPVVFEHICPMIQLSHGIGGDLKTFVRARDLCAI